MELLKEKLDQLINDLTHDQQTLLRDRLSDLVSVYPFNEYEYIISSLMGFGKISLDDYYEIRDEYIARNMYLYIFEISSPRGFGEQWAQGHLKGLVPDLIKPTKKVDPEYKGDYDFILKEGEAVSALKSKPHGRFGVTVPKPCMSRHYLMRVIILFG